MACPFFCDDMSITSVMVKSHGTNGIRYGVASISRLLKIIGLVCRISSLLYGSFAKETYNFKEPTTCSHPIMASGDESDLTITQVNG